MSDGAKTFLERLSDRIERLIPIGYRLHHKSSHILRRAMRKPRTVAEGPNLLPLLIQVLAAFSKIDGVVLEEEIDSSLGFLRYDYPEAVYSELRKLFRQALNEQQDLMAMAQKLSAQLSADRKIMLGVQLYDLITKTASKPEQIAKFYAFMSQLGMAAQAIDIVYQLNAADDADTNVFQKNSSPLESLCFGHDSRADVILKGLAEDERLLAFRYHDLLLLKNQSARPIVVRGRPLAPAQFCRVYPGQRIVLGEQVLTYQDLVFYFNAKKNVSTTRIYLTVNADDEVLLEKSRTRDSSLEVQFGLKVQVKALKKVDAVFNGVRLNPGAYVEGTLEDKIIFHDDSELSLNDLRRRARALGGRFPLKANKSEYLVSNNPGLLEADDILLSPGTGGEVLLKIQCDYENKMGRLEVLQADRPILIGEVPVRNFAPLADGDAIRVDTGQILRCDFSERIIEEERNVISTLEVRDLQHRYTERGATALDSISFSITRGEMVCVMGASGSGKSTLMRVIAGRLPPRHGEVLLNSQSLYDNIEALRGYVTYIPQEDAFDEHLTIEENLDFAAAIRAPHLSSRDRSRRIDGKLIELGLTERRTSLVGSAVKKVLSGGERKRLNIGLDMIGSADVYLFDEPTSGLSSKDSEHVIEIIRSMAHNKVVLVTIHQPTSKIFQMFSKAMLLDKGGKLVFYGTPHEMLEYFAQAEHEQHFGTELGGCPACGTTRPEFIFDVLETPLRDLSGDIIYEENSQGQLVPARRFSPDYWRDKYESFRLLQDMRQVAVRKQPAPVLPPAVMKVREPIRWRDEWTQLKTLLQRAFISKLRNRANLLTTIVEAPMLAALIATVLAYSESGQYDFASAYHIPTYLFLSLVCAMFLGLTNSADDIIRDRVVLQRERNLKVRLPYYIFAKAVTLAMFAAIQCILFVLIGNAILEVQGMFWLYAFYNFVTAFGGIAIGLLISALVADAKTAANIVPLVLIPQIILGGALIKYEEMNRNLDFIYTVNRFFSTHPGSEAGKRESALQVPLICQFMPMRWSYEALVVAQAKMNPLTSRQRALQSQINVLVEMPERTAKESERLEDLKDTLAMLSGLESATEPEIERRLARVDRVIKGAPLGTIQLRSKTSGITAERLYVNQKISDLVAKAETEQSDYRRSKSINVFFGPDKYLGRFHTTVLVFNSIVLLGFAAIALGLLHLALRRQLR
jgi:ABC-type multidrug transport system ATPase subunit